MRTRHFVLISAAMLLVTGLVGVGLGQSRDRSLANLTLELAAAKNQFVQLEPIPVVITLQNDTWGFIRAHEALGFDSNLIDLFVGVEGQPMKKIEDQSVTRDAVASPKRFYPGERRQQAETLTFGLDRMFPQPGHYRMQAVLRSI